LGTKDKPSQKHCTETANFYNLPSIPDDAMNHAAQNPLLRHNLKFSFNTSANMHDLESSIVGMKKRWEIGKQSLSASKREK